MSFLGRKRELLLAATFYLLGGLTTAYAPSLFVLLVGRVIYGLGIGLVRFPGDKYCFLVDVIYWNILNQSDCVLQALHGAPLYISETCPSQIRGTLISLKELLIVLGMLVRYVELVKLTPSILTTGCSDVLNNVQCFFSWAIM